MENHHDKFQIYISGLFSSVIATVIAKELIGTASYKIEKNNNELIIKSIHQADINIVVKYLAFIVIFVGIWMLLSIVVLPILFRVNEGKDKQSNNIITREQKKRLFYGWIKRLNTMQNEHKISEPLVAVLDIKEIEQWFRVVDGSILGKKKNYKKFISIWNIQTSISDNGFQTDNIKQYEFEILLDGIILFLKKIQNQDYYKDYELLKENLEGMKRKCNSLKKFKNMKVKIK
ncbi:MAG: hypothetical protein PHW34_10525 [Hespellia sp.]|nr:hypothetical protein [Hespellia sp.]